MDREQELTDYIKPDCESCHFWTEVFDAKKIMSRRLSKVCSQKECEYKRIAKKVFEFLNRTDVS